MTEEEIKNPGPGEPEEEKTPEEIILEMKKNMISKEEYEKLEKKHNKLLNDIVKGNKIEAEKVELNEEQRKQRIKDLRNSLYTDKVTNLNNLDYWKNTLELRQLIIESGEDDPMIAKGKMFNDSVTQEDKIEKVVDVVQQCIDKSEGSSKVFTSLLQDRLVDDPQILLKLSQKKRQRSF